ncbi:unknown [Firmicutes bacterium CAG:552]|nr:unknown [Firmicutes bacterium CAG:552]
MFTSAVPSKLTEVSFFAPSNTPLPKVVTEEGIDIDTRALPVNAPSPMVVRTLPSSKIISLAETFANALLSITLTDLGMVIVPAATFSNADSGMVSILQPSANIISISPVQPVNAFLPITVTLEPIVTTAIAEFRNISSLISLILDGKTILPSEPVPCNTPFPRVRAEVESSKFTVVSALIPANA